MYASLQLLESCGLAFGVERDDLAVEDERRRPRARPFRERRRNLRKLIRLLVAEPRPETRDRGGRADRGAGLLILVVRGVPSPYLDDRADAVVFRFVDQMRVVERRVGERREHRL